MGLGPNPSHSTFLLCALGKVTSLLWASLLSSLNEDNNHDLPPRATIEINERIQIA